MILDIISGPDGKDHRVAPFAAEKSANSPPEQLKVAFFVDDGFSSPTQEIQDAVKRAAESLRSHVAVVREDRPQSFAEGPDLWLELMIPSWAVAARYWQQEYARMAGTKVSPERLFLTELLLKWLDHLYGTGKFSPKRHLELEIALEKYAARMLAFMDSYDVLICPVSNTSAGRHSTAHEFDEIPLDEFWDVMKRDVGR